MRETHVRELTRRLEQVERKKTSRWRERLLKGEPEGDSLLISLSDLMTILLMFFVLLSQVGVSKGDSRMKETSAPMVSSGVTRASVIEPFTVIRPIHDQRPESYPPAHEVTHRIVVPPPTEDWSEIKEEILSALSLSESEDFYLRSDRQGPVLVLGEQVLFETGRAEVLEPFQPVLERLAQFLLRMKEYSIKISGHTDDAPICTDRFPSNWELSTARAVNVAKALLSQGVDPRRIVVEGFSEYRPLVENDTEAHRRTNRRVEVALVRKD